MANSSKKSVAKAKPTHPPTSSMVNSAIESLKERGGSSLHAIKQYLIANYQVDVEKLSPHIKAYLKSAVANGQLVQTKGKGASGSFKLPVNKKNKQPASAKAAKKNPADATMRKAAKVPGGTVKKNIKPKTIWYWAKEPLSAAEMAKMLAKSEAQKQKAPRVQKPAPKKTAAQKATPKKAAAQKANPKKAAAHKAAPKKAPAAKKPSKNIKTKTIRYWAEAPLSAAEIVKMLAKSEAQKQKAPKVQKPAPKIAAQKTNPKKAAAQKAAPKKAAAKK